MSAAVIMPAPSIAMHSFPAPLAQLPSLKTSPSQPSSPQTSLSLRSGALSLSGSPSSPRFSFERLPPELQREIFSYLDYQSLIALSCVNSYLHRTVNPQTAPIEDKFAFVMRAENYFPKHFPVVVQGQERPGNFACYICFRVREPVHFDAEQPHSIYVNERGEKVRSLPKATPNDNSNGGPASSTTHRLVTLRRFCIECGVRHGLHAPGDSIFTKLRQELWG
ncbi:hypothetical protein jhhlp_004717 [Lomentospora prolificans]|uniref:F-box domain-containing protein n=1 Tax=Lomentospora prolificans TaxID=41688 RepID=A0A2N3N8E1_9PEZI|nr:hypothetical protein jhhlp_004717 [Lomentospora prolificans]